MRYLALLVLLVNCFWAPAQNMVHNPGFEAYTTCPNAQAQVSYCVEWVDATGATSDYDNACCTNNQADVPINVYGNQLAYEGNAYAGLSPYYASYTDVKEYIQGNTDALLVGGLYQVTIHVSKADNAPSSSDGLQIFFYKNGYNMPFPAQTTIPANPQIDYTSYGIITDAVNWTTLTDTFTADSAYTHLIIGTFKNVADINATGPNYSYFFIDYVDVELVNPALHTADTVTNVRCNGGSNGIAVVTALGGTAPYTYLWQPGNQTTASISGLTAGSYTCRVIDAAQDTVLDTLIVTQPPALTATTSQTNVSCNGGNNGSATVNVSGGTPGYTYSWAPSGGTNATASNLSANTYTCTITDANNCTLQKVFTITQAGSLAATTSQVNVLCYGAATGSATVNASGGTVPYTYAWAPSGGTNPTASNLTAGNYTCTITDFNNCTLQKTFTLTQPPAALSATTAQTNVTCNGNNNGIASVTVSGGTPGYTYAWTPSGGNAANATGLAPASYTCTITDANGCVLTKNFTITQPAVLTATISHTDVSCYGSGDGTATVVASGGTAAYTYSWAPSGGNNATASNLLAGNYTCTITDANGCTTTQSATITEPAANLSIVPSQSNVLCNGASTGIASAIVSGGTLPYSYSWAPAGGNWPNAYNLPAGSYTVTVTDAHNCVLTQTYNITEGPAIIAAVSQADILCHGANNGIATVLTTGGVPPYTFSWSPTGGNNPNATNLAGGIYTCTITDHNNCTHTETVTISEPAAISVSDSQVNVVCYGDSNGYAQVSVSGGTAPYTYSWLPAGGNGNAAPGLQAGAYTCAIKDYNNCMVQELFNITQPEQLSAHTSKTNVVCQNLNQGVAIAVGTGGEAPYSYLWTPGNSTDTIITGLGIGKDTCLITDINGCSYRVEFNIVDTSQPFNYSIADSALGCRTALLNAIPAQGSSAAISYLWLFDSTTAGGNPVNHSFPQAGSNSVELVIVNAVGCYDTLAHNFSINYPMLAGFITEPDVPLPNTPINFSNTSSPYATIFSWDFGDGTSSTEENPRKSYNDSGLYHICLIASDTNSCIDTVCKDIPTDIEKSVGIPSAFSPNGDGVNDVLYIRGYRLAKVKLRVYNRWGNIVFETDTKEKGWDGTYKGQAQTDEAYAYTLEATFSDGTVKQINGSISLLR